MAGKPQAPELASAPAPAPTPANITRIALGLSYNGQAYQGWQSQKSGLTIQDKLEAALGRFTAQERVTTLCAGRTDAGVRSEERRVGKECW